MKKVKLLSKKIKVFGVTVCPACLQLKAFLKDNNIKFEDIDVSESESGLDEMIEISDQMSVPVIKIGNEVFIGFDKEILSSILNIGG